MKGNTTIHQPNKTSSKYGCALLLACVAMFFRPCCLSAQPATLQRIKSVSHSLAQESGKRKTILTNLKKTELKSSQLQLNIAKLDRQLKKQSLSIQQLQRQQHQYRRQLHLQIDFLKKNINALYILQKQPRIQLLLNHNTANKTSRMIVYYHYINAARIQSIAEIKQILKKIKNNKSKIHQQIHAMHLVKKNTQHNQAQLTSELSRRHTILKKINRHIHTRRALLISLTQRHRQLETTVKGLNKNIHLVNKQIPFSSMKGRLTWPTPGRLISRFGQNILHSQLHQTGIVIRAPAGQKVHAIAKGTVIFSKWLLGYGQLLIINHGNGYMTLYGRNQSLFVKMGDTVNPGETIATVGNTGGNQETGLYFAIRHNAIALNPVKWCHNKHTNTRRLA